MEKRISDLVSGLEPADIEMKNSNIVSADRIKEMTMKKIKQQPKARRDKRLNPASCHFAPPSRAGAN